MDAEFVYTNGSCYEFYKILKQIFPCAVAYTNIDHVWTEIYGVLYDINGIREEGFDGLLKMSEHGFENTADKWKQGVEWFICADEKKKL